MNEKKCQKKDCKKEAITLSLFCGEHTDNKVLREALLNLQAKRLRNLVWDEVEIKKITITHKEFFHPQITNTDFTKVVFKECRFVQAVFEHLVFTDCEFLNCEFEDADFTDVTFHQVRLADCVFNDGRFNEYNFADETMFEQCVMDGCSFNGGIFSETGTNANTKFLNCAFTQASINQAQFGSCQFVESSFSKTSFYDSVFTNCYFDTITHDFKLTGPPLLCDFRGSKFVNMSIPQSLRKWNNLKLEPLSFYESLVEWLISVNHPNYLSELAVALNRLLSLNYRPTLILNDDIKSLFKRLTSAAAQAGDYRTLGDILSEYGRIPEEFRINASFFLPPPSNASASILETGATLTITAELSLWKLSDVSRLLLLLSELEKELPASTPQVIKLIEQGSIIVTILGPLKQLLTLFQCLLDAKKTRWDIKLKELEYEEKLLGLKRQEMDLEKQKVDTESAKLNLDKQKIDLQHYKLLKEVDTETAVLKLVDMRLELIKKIPEGADFDKYRKTAKGKRATAISKTIQKEFPILQLKIED